MSELKSWPRKLYVPAGDFDKIEIFEEYNEDLIGVSVDRPLGPDVEYLRADLAVPSGWKLVPNETTAEMRQAFMTETYADCMLNRANSPDRIYRTMLAAAPKEPK